MPETQFPFEQSKWHGGDRAVLRRWYDALESIGTESVRVRLAQNDSGSGGVIGGIGTETIITKGFAEEWLAWHDRQKAQRETGFRNRQIFWTRWAAVAASVAASAAAIGWAITVWQKW